MSRPTLPEEARHQIDALRDLDAPTGVLDTVMAEVNVTRQERPFSWLAPAAMAAAAVAAVALIVVFLPRATPSGQAAPGTIETRIPLPTGAHPASADASGLWLGDEQTGQVLRLDLGTEQISDTVAVNQPTSVAYDLWPVSDGTSIWTAGFSDRALVRIDIGSMSVADRWPIDAVPYRIAVAASGIWVTDFVGGSVMQVAPGTGEVVRRVPVADATGIALGPDAVWVAQYWGGLVHLDPNSGAVVATYSVAAGATDLLLHGDQLWITGINGRRLERFDTVRGAVAASTDAVTAVAFVGEDCWASMTGGVLARLDAVTLEHTGLVDLGDNVVTDQMVVAGGRLWAFGDSGGQNLLYVVRPGSP